MSEGVHAPRKLPPAPLYKLQSAPTVHGAQRAPPVIEPLEMVGRSPSCTPSRLRSGSRSPVPLRSDSRLEL